MSSSEQRPGGNGGSAGAPRFSLEKIYVKDLSFEVPNAPGVYNENQAQTQVSMDLKNSHQRLEDDVYEVCLHVALRASVAEQTLFLVEIDQAGLFQISGYEEHEMRQLIAARAPAALYPYCREAISSTIGRGGFPSILLQPIDFDALLEQAQAEKPQLQA